MKISIPTLTKNVRTGHPECGRSGRNKSKGWTTRRVYHFGEAHTPLRTQTTTIANGGQKERAVPNIRHGPERSPGPGGKLIWEQ